MSKVLVTGGAGFIGSHTSLQLIEKGYEVIIIDSFVNSSPKVIQRIKKLVTYKNSFPIGKISFIEGDLTNYELINNIFLENYSLKKPIEGVIHFAGLKAINESINDPLRYWDINLVSTINLLKAMNSYDCKNIVFSSSAAVYGLTDQKLISEESNLMPINPYGRTKLTIEKILHDLFLSDSKKWNSYSRLYSCNGCS